MSKTKVFEKYYKEYDEWFDKNRHIYQSELNAIKRLIPNNKYGLEVGVGTGRFAFPLGIRIAVEPSVKMAEQARKLGIKVYENRAEDLPFENNTFDFLLFVTSVCFVDNIFQSLSEARRVLKKEGLIIISFIDKESILGKQYALSKNSSKFYKEATFYSVTGMINILKKSGFKVQSINQTVFHPSKQRIETSKKGYGKGSFVSIKAGLVELFK